VSSLRNTRRSVAGVFPHSWFPNKLQSGPRSITSIRCSNTTKTQLLENPVDAMSNSFRDWDMTKVAAHNKRVATKQKKTDCEPVKINRWKSGWRTIGGKHIFLRSKWESNYARYLETLKIGGFISEWEYEVETFWFDGVKRGCVSYKPDFKVTKQCGAVEYHEVKGWMDARSATKLKRKKKYHPSVKVILRDATWFKANARMLRALPGHE
jgi:hypothetical protein